MGKKDTDSESKPKHAAHAAAPASELSDNAAPKHAAARRALLVVGIICIVVAVVAIGSILFTQWQLQQAQSRLESEGVTQISDEKQVELVDNPIDFATLKQQNSEVYAYIYIPNTNVSYPIVQSATDDNYYLTRNIDGEVSIEGAIYTQVCNHADFHDPVTVIYGHNIYDPGMMFYQLHKFEDADFFSSNDTFYIYTPTTKYTYQIIAAYEYDNRHILNSFDFSKTDVIESYFQSVLAPNSLNQNVREGVTLTADDHIVQLSTCTTTGNDNSRYIVTGKLVDEQLTR